MTDDTHNSSLMEEDNDASEQIYVLDIDSQTYAVSLAWNQSSKDSLKSDARSMAKKFDSKLFCLYENDDVAMYGLSSSEEFDHDAGQPSLAATLAQDMRYPYLGAFQIEETIWYLAVIDDNGSIIFDKAYASEKEIKNNFLNIYPNLRWTNIHCPEKWNIINSNEKNIELLVVDKKKIYLKYVNIFDDKKVKLASITLIAVTALFAILYFFYPTAQKPQPIRKYIPTRIVRKPLPKPQLKQQRQWINQPLPDDFVNSCAESILTHGNIVFPGWNMPQNITCTPSGISTTVTTMPYGTINWIKPFAPKTNNFSPKIIYSGAGVKLNVRSIQLRWFIPHLATYPFGSVPAKNIDAVGVYLVRTFNEMHKNISLSVHIFKEKASYRGHEITLGHQKILSFSIKTKIDIRAFLPIFNKIKAVVIKEIEYNTKSASWSMRGKIYGRTIKN